jgi:hypothetical protein
MPNLPNWNPPQVKAMTPEAYVSLVTMINIGTLAIAENDKKVAEGCQSQCMPPTKPRIGDMAASLYLYIPPELLPWSEVSNLLPGMEPPVDNGDRPSHYTFRFGRKKLMAALDAVTPPEVVSELGSITDEQKNDPYWWAVALAAGGVLFWLAKRNVYIAAGSALLPVLVPLLRVVGTILIGAASAGIISEAPEALKWVATEGVLPLVQPTGNAIGWVVGIVGVVGGLALVSTYIIKDNNKKALPATAAA